MADDFGPLISIITVVKSDLSGLKATARSILGQKNSNVEWLIVDGGSDSETAEYVAAIQSSFNVRRLSLPPLGIYNAMNFGASQANGKWLWYLNAGDLLLAPNAVLKMSELVSEAENTNVVATPVLYISTSGHLYDCTEIATETRGDYVVARFNHQGCIVRKSAFQVLGGFDESLKLAADGKLLDRFVSESAPFFSNHILVGFEMGGLSGMNYRQTLKEIDSYRPTGNKPLGKRFFLLFSNGVRLWMLKNDHRLNSIRSYLNKRERQKIEEVSRVHLMPTHWPEHSQGSSRIFACCLPEF